MDAEERIQAVSQFLLQSPPGEINDVLNGTVETPLKAQIALSAHAIYNAPARFRRTRAHRGR